MSYRNLFKIINVTHKQIKLIDPSISSTADIDSLIEGQHYEWIEVNSQKTLQVLHENSVDDVLQMIHIEQGHGGRDKVEATFHEKYYFVGLRRKVTELLVKCSCVNTKKSNAVQPLLTIRTTAPLERVHGDLMDAGGGIIWCSIVDNFSKVAVTVQIAHKTPENVAKTFKLFIAKYGKPITIQWDNGSEQKGCFPEWCQRKDINIINSGVGHPQSNGKVERYQQTILNMAIAIKQVRGGAVTDYLLSYYLLYPPDL